MGSGPPSSPTYDAVYDDYDGRKSYPNTQSVQQLASPECQRFDNPAVLSMQDVRWYAGTEALADGTIALTGSFTSGGYVNRNMPNTDPTYEGGGATPTYKFYPKIHERGGAV
ncbi:hypothetical protein HD554DRAFT_2104514, partial [Boletus coccyginus]